MKKGEKRYKCIGNRVIDKIRELDTSIWDFLGIGCVD